MRQILLGGSQDNVSTPSPNEQLVDQIKAFKKKYFLTYDVDPENGIPDLSKNGVKSEDLIVAAQKDEGHKLKHTNIFYKDKLTIDNTEILVLIRVKKTSSKLIGWSINPIKTIYKIELGGIYLCEEDTRIEPCPIRNCYQLLNLYKLSEDGKKLNKTDIVINIRNRDFSQYNEFNLKIRDALNKYIIDIKDNVKLIGNTLDKLNFVIDTNKGSIFFKDVMRNLAASDPIFNAVFSRSAGRVIGGTTLGAIVGVAKGFYGILDGFVDGFKKGAEDWAVPRRVIDMEGESPTEKKENEIKMIKSIQKLAEPLFDGFMQDLGVDVRRTDLDTYIDLPESNKKYHNLKTLIGLWEIAKKEAAEAAKAEADGAKAKADGAKAEADGAAQGGRNTQKTRNNKRYKKNSRRYIRKNNKK